MFLDVGLLMVEELKVLEIDNLFNFESYSWHRLTLPVCSGMLLNYSHSH